MSWPLLTRKSNALFTAPTLTLLFTLCNISGSTAEELKPEVKQLLKTTNSWDGVKYSRYPSGQPEVTILHYKIPPHSTLPWHEHPVINAAYVLSGHLKVTRESDGKSVVVGPGDVLAEMVDLPHRGQSTDEPVELIVFYAGTPTVPLVIKSNGQD